MALAINQKLCKGCGICIEFCPKKVLALSDKGKVYAEHLGLCIDCGLCELRCPDFAIQVIKAGKGEKA